MCSFFMFAGWKYEGLLPLSYRVSDRDKDNNGSPCGSWGLYIFQWNSNTLRKIQITWSSKEFRACNTWILSNETSRLWKKNISKIGHKTHRNTLRILGEEKLYCYYIYQSIQSFTRVVCSDNIFQPCISTCIHWAYGVKKVQ